MLYSWCGLLQINFHSQSKNNQNTWPYCVQNAFLPYAYVMSCSHADIQYDSIPSKVMLLKLYTHCKGPAKPSKCNQEPVMHQPPFLSLKRGVPPSTLPPSGTRSSSITPAAGEGTCTDVCIETQQNTYTSLPP